MLILGLDSLKKKLEHCEIKEKYLYLNEMLATKTTKTRCDQ